MEKSATKTKRTASIASQESLSTFKLGLQDCKPQFKRRKTFAVGNKTSAKSILLEVLIFVAIFLAVFLPANFAFSQVSELKLLAAYSSQAALSALGVASQVDLSFAEPRLVSEKFTAEINSLCAAATELAVLLGIVFASRDRPIVSRARGILAGFALVFLFNPVRIATTLYFYNSRNLVASTLFHDVLFRASIIIFIVVFYAIWYYWSFPAGKKLEK